MAPRLLSIEDYEITRDGQIINKITNHVLKPQPNGKGYLRVMIGKKRWFVHRLVALKHIPNPNNYKQVNHKDGNKFNNCVENLEWVSNQQNRDHAVEIGLQVSGERCSYAKLNWEKVDFIRNHPEIPTQELADLFSVSRTAITKARNYETWKNRPKN